MHSRPLGNCRALIVGAMMLMGSLVGWAGAGPASAQCPTPAVDGNLDDLDDLRAYADCIATNRAGCGLNSADPVQDVCYFDTRFRPCPVPVPCRCYRCSV